MLKQFYQKVLPAQGVYCISGLDNNGKITNRFVETLSDVFATIDRLKGQNLNVFVAPGSFQNYSRKAENALYLKSFFIDLDVGEESKKYKSQKEALDALNKFVSDVGLPPPITINSGRGVHAYWPFAQQVPAAEWRAYALKFKEMCLEHLFIDPVVTADTARIMRCPETLNYKTDPPSETGFYNPPMVEDYPELDFDMFKEFLGPVSLDSPLKNVQRGLDEDTKSLAGIDPNYETYFSDIVQKSIEGVGCAQIRDIILNAKTLSQPLWHSGLSIARHCADWETAIHLMSEDHPQYNYDLTIRKANETLDKPHSCAVFESRNPGGCEGCPFRGVIKNPLKLGRRFKEAEGAEENTVWEDPDPEKVPAFPKDLRPFVRGENGGVYFIPKPEVDENGVKSNPDPILLSRNDIYPIKRMYSVADGACLIVRHTRPLDPLQEFMLRLRQVVSPDELRKILAEQDIVLDKEQGALMFLYFRKWNDYLQDRQRAEVMRAQMGWTENNQTFVIGSMEICQDGSERPVAASPLVKNVSKLMKRNGTLEEWKATAAWFNEPEMEIHAFALLCGFGSPLMNLTATPGVSFCLMSADSGTGKTGSLNAGLSIFADPVNIRVLDGNATENAFIGRYLGLKNIQFGLDEIQSIEAEQLSKLIHRVSQGKAKMRMQSSVNAERELEQSASLINVMTANQDLYDKLMTFKASPDGEMARLVQFNMRKPPLLVDHPELNIKVYDGFRNNYGHAGPEFIKHYFARGEAYVRKILDTWLVRFAKDYGDNSAYRFYANGVAAVMTGGQLAMEIGLINYDLDRIYNRVILEMIQARDSTTKLNNMDYKGLITEFINKYHTGFLIFNGDRMTSEPRTGLVGRIEVDTQTQYISKREFKKFLAELQVSTKEFEFSTQKEGVFLGTRKVRLSSGWKAGMGTPPIYAYAFKTELTDDILRGSGH